MESPRPCDQVCCEHTPNRVSSPCAACSLIPAWKCLLNALGLASCSHECFRNLQAYLPSIVTDWVIDSHVQGGYKQEYVLGSVECLSLR